eukprot:RCo034879
MAHHSAVPILNVESVSTDIETVFHEMAPDGQLPREALLQLVRRLGLSDEEAVTEVELEDALGVIREHCPDRPYNPDFLTLEEIYDLAQLLSDTVNIRPTTAEELLEDQQKGGQENFGARAIRWVRRRASWLWAVIRHRHSGDEVYEKRMKPTTKLVIS